MPKAYQIKINPPAAEEEADGSPVPEAETEIEDSSSVVEEAQAVEPVKSEPPSDPGEILAKARKLYESGQYAQAVEQLEGIVELAPESFAAWELLGRAHWKAGRLEDTIEVWQRMSVIHGHNPQSYNLLGQAQLAADDIPEAIVAFERSLAIDPDQFSIRYSLGAAQRWAGNLRGAIKTLARCRLENPQDPDTALQLAKALMSSRMYADALPLWRELVEKNPDDHELRAEYAQALLHQGEFESALEQAEQSLELKSDNIAALEVVSSIAALEDRPEDVLATQKIMLKLADTEAEKIRILNRIISSDRVMWDRRGGDYDMHNAAMAADMLLELEPEAVSTHLLLGEILTLQGRLGDAKDRFELVLEKFNPNNMRAMRGLLDIQLAGRDYEEAEKMMRALGAFNPRDPYMHYYRARLAFERGRYREAFRQLDLLEQAGARGAVAVLLYHGLSDNKYDTIMTLERFEKQLRAFRDADFKFITPLELEEYFEYRNPPPYDLDSYRPERVVIVTFDDARLDAFELGTAVAHKLGVKFAMHVPPPYVGTQGEFFADWETLKHYQDSGRWVFGSHLQNASDSALLNGEGLRGRPLANRIWLPDEQRKETLDEYRRRMESEYADSHAELAARLAPDCDPLFVAYPYGDIGQQTSSDAVGVIAGNLAEARKHYRIGFIQSRFGYAVKGDDPLLYQRHEPLPHETAAEVLSYTIAYHPVFLARRTRAEYEALRGNFYAAQRMIALLERDDYPADQLASLRRYVSARLTGRAGSEDDTGLLSGPLNWKPELTLEAEHVEDSTDRSNFRALAGVDLRVLPNLELGAFAGMGSLDQDYVEDGTEINLTVDENIYGGRLGFDIVVGDPQMSPIEIDLAGGQRDFSGDAEYSQTFYNAMLNFSPRPPLSLQFYFEHDAVPWARSVRAEKSYDLLQPLAVLRPRDYWDLTAAYSAYDYSDDNSAGHINLTSMWDILPDWGLRAGLRYSYLSSDAERDDYWTPYKLTRYTAILEWKRRLPKISYSLQLRAGTGKEDVRPEEEERYRSELQNGIAQNLAVLPEEPSTDWTEVYGISAEISYYITPRFSLNARAAHSKLPDYDSTTLSGGIGYEF